MAYQGDPRAFAAQSMLQPLQRHTPTQAPNKLGSFLSGLGNAALGAGASYLGGMGAKKLGGAMGLGGVGNPGLMQAAQGGGGVDADRAWVQDNWNTGKMG